MILQTRLVGAVCLALLASSGLANAADADRLNVGGGAPESAQPFTVLEGIAVRDLTDAEKADTAGQHVMPLQGVLIKHILQRINYNVLCSGKKKCPKPVKA